MAARHETGMWHGGGAELRPSPICRSMQTVSEADGAAVREIEETGAKIANAREALGEVIFGQESVIDQTLVTVLAGGHALLVGVPGLAKTLLVHTMGQVLGLDDKRVQFTPDLMPADILGSEVLEESDQGHRSFRFIKGPVFCQLLMADEINRASPRTQSALLQAMQEKQVTVAGVRYELPSPFHVLATQNPLEQEGTYPLPEAQLDRFLMQIDVNYPDLESERRMLLSTTGETVVQARNAMSAEDLMAAQRLVRRVPVGEKVVNAILELVRAARPEEGASAEVERHVAWGPGPRASQALMLAVRARALIDGRFSPSIEDVTALAAPVLRHRMALNFSARAEGVTVGGVIDRLCRNIG
jgi:MoxR-like ATPase